MISRRQIALISGCFAGLAGLAGCGSGVALVTTPPDPSLCKTPVTRPAGPTATANFSGAAFTGKVMAGPLPVPGASVQLYAAGATGNGSAATRLGSAVITDANGAFSFAAGYTCPFNLSLVYVVATGGKAGPTGPTNAGIVLTTALGACNAISGTPAFVVNEVTTLASAYALQQFFGTGGSIGASSTNFTGLKLAAASAANLVNVATGTAPGANFPSTGKAPTSMLNTLANALNACIVAGPSAAACTQLYTAATVSGTAPANTLDAALNIARHPAVNVATLFTLGAPASAFTPALTAAPSDWTMFATYSGGGMKGPSALGVDSAGNVRVASYFNRASYFNNTGTPTIAAGVTDGILNESYGMVVDVNDNVWVTDEQTPFAINAGFGAVSVFNSNGATVSGSTGYAAGGLNFPLAIAMDTTATAWIVDYGNSHVTLLNNSGTPLSGATGYTTSQFDFPVAVAVDSKCYAYVTNQGGNTTTRIAPDGASFTSFITGGGGSGVAIDAADNVWVANYFGSSVGLLSSTQKIISSGYTGGGIKSPQGIAVDGAGNVWVANYRGVSITELAGASATLPGAPLSPAAGFGPDAALLEAFAVAIDASGNLWVTNFGNDTLTEFIGMAAPVRTPALGPVTTP